MRIPAAEVTETLTMPNTGSALPWRFRVIEENGKGTVIRSASGWKRFTSEPRRLTSLTAEFPWLTGEPVVFSRPCRAREALARAMRFQGVRTLAETDDNYFANPHLNVFSRDQADYEQKQGLHSIAMASMHGIVFSTAWLRDRYHKEFRKRFKTKGLAESKWMPELFVCRNHMPSWAWPEPEDYDGPVRFGFMGSASHIFDMSALGYASFHAAKHLGATTTCIGYNPADPDPDIPDSIEIDGEMTSLRSPASLRMSEIWSKVVDTHIKWVDPAVFKRGGLPLDISLAPLAWNDFNAGRSDIKCIEGSVAGAAMVCSSHPVFSSAGWKHGENCLMGGSQEELATQVVRLIKDAKLRASLVENAQAMIRESRNEQTMKQEWSDALA